MWEIRTYGSEGVAAQANAPFLPYQGEVVSFKGAD